MALLAAPNTEQIVRIRRHGSVIQHSPLNVTQIDTAALAQSLLDNRKAMPKGLKERPEQRNFNLISTFGSKRQSLPSQASFTGMRSATSELGPMTKNSPNQNMIDTIARQKRSDIGGMADANPRNGQISAIPGSEFRKKTKLPVIKNLPDFAEEPLDYSQAVKMPEIGKAFSSGVRDPEHSRTLGIHKQLDPEDFNSLGINKSKAAGIKNNLLENIPSNKLIKQDKRTSV